MDKAKNVKEKPKKNRFLIIFICIFLSAVIVLGGVFGTIAAVRESRSVAKYGDTYLDKGAAVYLAAYYKYRYIDLLKQQGINAYDSSLFWQKEAEEGKSYADALRESFEEYVSALLVANAIYDSYADFNKSEKEKVKAAAEAMLRYSSAAGSRESFDSLCEIYGFDYDGFLLAAEYLYKADSAMSAMYGEDGSGISSSTEECERYLATYTHVDLMFIRLEDTFVRDDEGNISYDSDGVAITRPLTAEELAERQDIVSKMRTYISENTVTVETFEYYLEKSDGDSDMYDVGYYFNQNAETTGEFSEVFSEVVDKAYGMEIGEYAEVECPAVGGVCFIYKYNVAEGAYANSDNPFFSDFYSDAVSYIYPIVLTELSADAELRDSFYEIDIVSLPRLSEEFIIKSWN